MTFSLLARCPQTQQFGAIVASRVLAVGTRVIAARAGVGVAATQAGSWTLWRRALLDSVAQGRTPGQAIVRLRGEHDLTGCQVAVGGASEVEAFTDGACPAAAGHALADYDARSGRPADTDSPSRGAGGLEPPEQGWVSAQGNTLADESVWPAMLDGFLGCDGTLIERLVAGLLAGDAAGGDSRGHQSAAVLVVPGQLRISPRHAPQHPSGAWDDPFVDLRVDDDPDAVAVLAELTRTLQRHRGLIRSSSAITHADALLLQP